MARHLEAAAVQQEHPVGRCLRRCGLKVTLVTVNVLFFFVASFLLSEGSRVRKAGWLDVFEDSYPWFHWIFVLIVIALSILVAIMAVTGLYTLLCWRKKKWVLWIYVSCGLLTTLLFVVAAVVAIHSLVVAGTWSSRTTIDRTTERQVSDRFNKVLCLSEAVFLCTAPSKSLWFVHYGSDDLRDLYLAPGVAASIKTAMSDDIARHHGQANLLQLCDDTGSALHDPLVDHGTAAFCGWCAILSDRKQYDHIVAWVNSKCAPDADAAAFCVARVWREATKTLLDDVPSRGFVPVNASNVDEEMSPYAHCREPFLEYWAYLSWWLLALAGSLLVFMALVLRGMWLVHATSSPYKNREHHGAQTPERRPLVNVSQQKPRKHYQA